MPAMIPTDADSPALDLDDSRYGRWRISLPLHVLLSKYPNSHGLGTRKYSNEHSHTVLLSWNHEFKDFDAGATQSSVVFPPTNGPEEEPAIQHCTRWNSATFDHLEFAILEENKLQLSFEDGVCGLTLWTIKYSGCQAQKNQQARVTNEG